MKVIIRSLISRQAFQPLWKILYKLSKNGRNFGGGGDLNNSGELWIIGFLNKATLNKKQVTIFDVGAHNGTYASKVLEKFGSRAKLYCFEPTKTNFETLKNRLSDVDNVQVFNLGFSDQEEFATIYSSKEGDTTTSLYRSRLNNVQMTTNYTEEVCLKTLDNFCRDAGIECIDFLKLDAEGNELKILNGAAHLLSSNLIDFIQFEFGEVNVNSRTYFQDFFNLLSPFYNIYRVLQIGLEPINEYNYDDEVFRVTNYLAISKKNTLHHSTV